jgi:hypothetical protein
VSVYLFGTIFRDSVRLETRAIWEEFHITPVQTVSLSSVRIGDLTIATNPFELYCQLGLDIRRRSPARQLMIAQLTNDFLGYLPTVYGILGGGYSGQAIYWSRMEPYAGYLVVVRQAHRKQPAGGITPARTGTR